MSLVSFTEGEDEIYLIASSRIMIAKKKKIEKGSVLKKVFYSALIGIFLFVTVGFLVISNFKINQRRGELISQIEELDREIQVLQERNENLKAGIVQAETDIYWEEKLREQGYKKPGEEQVVVLPPENGKATSTVEEKNIFEKFLEKIGF